LEASTIVAKPIVPIKMVSLNAEPSAAELNAVPAVRLSVGREKRDQASYRKRRWFCHKACPAMLTGPKIL